MPSWVNDFMCDALSALTDIGDWPLWLRRAFVLTIPVSFPLWAFSFVVLFLLAFCVFAVRGLIDLWRK